MNKIKKIFSLLLIVTMFNPIISSANDGIVVTPSTFGSDSSLYRIQIGYDVTEIQDGSFSNLVNLQVIDVDKNNPYYYSYDGCLYNKDCTVLLCIPQNTSSVQMLKSVKSRSEHALDGLSENRKNRIDAYISGETSVSNNTNKQNSGTSSIGTSSNSSNSNIETIEQNVSNEVSNEPKQQAEPVTETVSNTQPETPSADEFQQYVHEEYGHVTFRYTGTGHSVIVVPEGVEKIAGFAQGLTTFNDEITTIYLPSTLKTIYDVQLFKDEGDYNYYAIFYQCRNLQNVYGGSYSYITHGSYIERSYNHVMVWSNSERYSYDKKNFDGLSY